MPAVRRRTRNKQRRATATRSAQAAPPRRDRPGPHAPVIPSLASMARLRSRSVRRRLLLAALLLVAVVLVLAAPVFMLAMAPAIALFAMVAHRLMPGEELIVRLRTRRARAPPPRAPRPASVRRDGRAPRGPPDRRRARDAPAARAAAGHQLAGARLTAKAGLAPGPLPFEVEEERARARADHNPESAPARSPSRCWPLLAVAPGGARAPGQPALPLPGRRDHAARPTA